MSRKCECCDNTVFDSNAYLKIVQLEEKEKEKLRKLQVYQKKVERDMGKYSDDVLVISYDVHSQKEILKVIQQCKNMLY